MSRRVANVFFKLPKSGRTVSVVIYPDGTGVEFERSLRRFVLRELDELDRRIILGFCRKWASNLHFACYHDDYDSTRIKESLQQCGLEYKASMQPKRIRAGGITGGRDNIGSFYRRFEDFELIDEAYTDTSIFAGVVLI